nr:aspartate/glutamate racemase family protein [Sphingobium sp. OAS761]
MREEWPEAAAHNLIDDSLAGDFATIGEISPAIHERFLTLGRYAARTGDGRVPTSGILFTCSAFRPAIERVRADLAIPVITPNEGAFDEALALCRDREGGGRIGLLLTFQGSVAPLTGEIHAMADAIGQARPQILPAVAEGALEALQTGDADRHDRLSAQALNALPPVDVIVIGQFSMARAAPLVRAARDEPVLTTPHMAVRKMRRLVEAAA